MDVRWHLPLEALVRLERAEKDAARSKRLRIVILAIGGYTFPAIAMSVGLSRRICQRWIYRYNEEGLEGLNDRRGQEPKPALTPEQAEQVCRRLEAGPTPDYDELEQAAIHAWQQAVLDADLMKTVCNAPYAKGATSS
jgi:transposase